MFRSVVYPMAVIVALSLTSCSIGVSVKGLVFDDKGAPITGASVTFTREQPGEPVQIQTSSTDLDGGFGAYLEGSGPCILVIRKAGFARHKERITYSPARRREIWLASDKP